MSRSVFLFLGHAPGAPQIMTDLPQALRIWIAGRWWRLTARDCTILAHEMSAQKCNHEVAKTRSTHEKCMAKNVANRKDAEIRVLGARLSLLRRAPTSTRSRSALRKAANHGIPGICLVWRADRSRTRTRIACTAPARRRRGVLPPEPSGWHAGDRLRHHAGRAPTRARATTRNEAAPTTPPRDRGETPRPILVS